MAWKHISGRELRRAAKLTVVAALSMAPGVLAAQNPVARNTVTRINNKTRELYDRFNDDLQNRLPFEERRATAMFLGIIHNVRGISVDAKNRETEKEIDRLDRTNDTLNRILRRAGQRRNREIDDAIETARDANDLIKGQEKKFPILFDRIIDVANHTAGNAELNSLTEIYVYARLSEQLSKGQPNKVDYITIPKWNTGKFSIGGKEYKMQEIIRQIDAVFLPVQTGLSGDPALVDFSKLKAIVPFMADGLEKIRQGISPRSGNAPAPSPGA